MLKRLMFTFLFAGSLPALGMVGQIDYQDRYPFVVRLSSEVGGCSGVASRTGLVSTAAHCVWDDTNGIAKNMQITYVTADGVTKTVKAKKIFIAPKYPEASWHWSRYKNKVSQSENSLNFARMNIHDIAFIVPAERVKTLGFPHWITEIVNQDGKSADIEKWLGPLDRAEMMSIGYGKFLCKDYNSRERELHQ
jgi:hypothetical protein